MLIDGLVLPVAWTRSLLLTSTYWHLHCNCVGVGVKVFVGVGVGVGQVGQSPNKVQDTPVGTDGNVSEQTYVIPWPIVIGELGEPQHGVNCIISKTDVTVIL